MLIAITTLEYPFELGDIKLVGVRLQHHFPSLQANDTDAIDKRMVLERLHRIDDNRHVVNSHKLFGNVLSHAVAYTASSQ